MRLERVKTCIQKRGEEKEIQREVSGRQTEQRWSAGSQVVIREAILKIEQKKSYFMHYRYNVTEKE